MSRTREDNLSITKLEALSRKLTESVTRLRAGTEPLNERTKSSVANIEKAVNELIGATLQ